jgi:hypothetical protein
MKNAQVWRTTRSTLGLCLARRTPSSKPRFAPVGRFAAARRLPLHGAGGRAKLGSAFPGARYGRGWDQDMTHFGREWRVVRLRRHTMDERLHIRTSGRALGADLREDAKLAAAR